MLTLGELKQWIAKIPTDNAEVRIKVYLNEPNVCSIIFVVNGEPYLSLETTLDKGEK